jgi:hypothetical protein
MTIARQRLAKHVPERYAVNMNRRPLLYNGFGHHERIRDSGPLPRDLHSSASMHSHENASLSTLVTARLIRVTVTTDTQIETNTRTTGLTVLSSVRA